MSIPVTDPFGVAGDRTMPTLELALDPSVAQQQLGRRLSRLAGRDGCVHVRAIRVTRYKPGRRCVIEYDVDVRRPDAEPERSEEHTSELQSLTNLVCRLLLEKKNRPQE